MQTLAVDWDSAAVRYVLAETRRGGTPRILAAGTVSVESGDAPLAERIGSALAQIVADTRAAKARLLVGIGRGQIDSAEFTVPVASELELPLIVANAAPGYFADSLEGGALDFLPSEPNADGSRDVLAMALPPAELGTIESVCKTAGMKPSRILVRPYALRTLLGESDAAGMTLGLCSGRGHSDVLLMSGSGFVAARSLKTPELRAGDSGADHLGRELQRLLLSLPERFDEMDVERLFVFGRNDEDLQTATRLADSLSCAGERVDPLAAVEADEFPADAGQFAPLIGMILEEAQDAHTAVDFANPRRPPAVASRRRPIVLAVSAAVILVSLAVYYVQSQFSAIDEENARLLVRVNELNELVKDSEPKRRIASTLSAWEQSNISWLDELRDLTLRFPPNRELVANRLSISPAANGSSTLVFGGIAREPAAVDRMESSIRDQFHQLRTPGLTEKQQQDTSSWSFQTTVAIRKREPSEYVSHLTAKQQALLAERDDHKPAADQTKREAAETE